MSVEHETFVIERVYAVPPARVFAAWADPGLKARWFCREVNGDGTPGGPGYTSAAQYRDIVPDERIVYAYELHAGKALASVSLATVTFAAKGDETILTLTEQIALLDELDTVAARERGMRFLLGRLGDLLPAPE